MRATCLFLPKYASLCTSGRKTSPVAEIALVMELVTFIRFLIVDLARAVNVILIYVYGVRCL